MNDSIVDEVRHVRDAHAAKFNYDLDAIFQDIKDQEKKSGLVFVSYPPRRTEPKQTAQPTEAAAAVGLRHGMADVIQEIDADQRLRGFHGRTAAKLQAEEAARHDEQDAARSR